MRKKRTIAPKTGRVREERKARVVELKQMGARWSIKKIAGTQYVYARVWVSGIRKEISLGQLNEELKRIFKEEDIQL